MGRYIHKITAKKEETLTPTLFEYPPVHVYTMGTQHVYVDLIQTAFANKITVLKNPVGFAVD